MGLKKMLHAAKVRVFGEGDPVVPVIKLHGAIAANRQFGKGISLASVEPLIARAFAQPGLKAVALLVNSPGGSVVQSAHIAARIREEAREKDVPVLAFAEDVMASGGYMLALAGDEIYAHEASLVGSIGVIAGGFGFSDLIKTYGIERRLYTAGEKKSTLDPFQAEDPEEIAEFKDMLEEIHDYFKGYVRSRRGKRLKPGAARSRMFSGQVFLGTEAVKLGLADDIGELRATLKARFGDSVKLPVIEAKKPLFGRISGSAQGPDLLTAAPDQWAEAGLAAVEDRLAWSRFGL